MTIREIAALAGVSPATVSMVLNGRTGIGRETRERVQKVLAENNYTRYSRDAEDPCCNIRFIKYSKHGMVVEENQGFISSIIDRIAAECRRFNYNLMMQGCNSSTVEETLQAVSGNGMDGVIFLGSELDAELTQKLLDVRVPLVVLDHSMRFTGLSSVVMANEDIAVAAVRYLYGMGHRTIGYYHSSVVVHNFEERLSGYRIAARQLGLTETEPICLTPTLKGAYMDMKKLLLSGAYKPEGAVFCANDTIAIGAARALQEQGYAIPNDISMIGVDDIPFSAITQPALTTMRVSRTLMGILVIDTLRKHILHPEWPPTNVNVIGQLVERDSVRAVSPA